MGKKSLYMSSIDVMHSPRSSNPNIQLVEFTDVKPVDVEGD